MKDSYVRTLNYGDVYVKESKSPQDVLIDMIQLVDGDYYEIYRREDSTLIAINVGN